VEEELKENGNGQPQFSLDLGTAFLVVEPISQTAIAWDKEHPEWRSNTNGTVNDTVELDLNHRNVYNAIRYNHKIRYTELMDNLGLSRMTIYRIITDLKEYGFIKRIGGDRHGTWVILK